jgi:selenophosphate synthetase-related protein
VTAIKHIKSKAGNELTFVTIANKQSYEVLEAKLVLAEGQDASEIAVQRDYTAIVDYDGTYGSVTLTPTK